MAKTSSLIRNYSRLSEANLDYKAQNIVNSLTDNTNFPETDPTLTNFSAVVDIYLAARANVANGGKNEVAQKNQAKADLLYQMSLLAIDIESLAKGDKVKLVSSGFDLAKDGESRPPMTGPLTFKLMDGMNPGELKLSVTSSNGAVSYNYEYTPAPLTENSTWITYSAITKQYVFGGLPSSTKVYTRVVAIARKNQQLYSDVIARVVQ